MPAAADIEIDKSSPPGGGSSSISNSSISRTRSPPKCRTQPAALPSSARTTGTLTPSATRSPSPSRGPLEVLVHIEVSGVCYGDVLSRDGGPPAPAQARRPLIGGHEGVGEVVGLGEAVAGATGLAAGDRVGLGWRHSTCGHCEHCVRGAETVCVNQEIHGAERRQDVSRWGPRWSRTRPNKPLT